jgi:hypothetical protein
MLCESSVMIAVIVLQSGLSLKNPVTKKFNNTMQKSSLPGMRGMADPGGRARCLVDVLRPVRGSVIMTRLVRLPLDGVGVVAVTVMLGSFPAALDMGLTTICTCDDMMPNKKQPLAFKVVCFSDGGWRCSASAVGRTSAFVRHVSYFSWQAENPSDETLSRLGLIQSRGCHRPPR